MQAVDALRWGIDSSSPMVQQQQEYAAALQAALRQPLGRPVSLQREVGNSAPHSPISIFFVMICWPN